MGIIISNQLKELKGIRILLLEGKRPVSKGWTLNPEFYERQEDSSWKHKETGELFKIQGEVFYDEPGNLPLEDQEVNKIIESNWNAGLLTGSGGVEVLDADSKELFDWACSNLPPTYTIKTGSEEEHYHFYFKRKGENQKIILEKENKHFGEWMASGQQVVMAGSIHPQTKREYAIFKDLPIAEISEDDIDSIKENFTDQGRTFVVQSPDWSMYKDVS
jgi:phenylalanyl-tRNA synthetase beta subunit